MGIEEHPDKRPHSGIKWLERWSYMYTALSITFCRVTETAKQLCSTVSFEANVKSHAHVWLRLQEVQSPLPVCLSHREVARSPVLLRLQLLSLSASYSAHWHVPHGWISPDRRLVSQQVFLSIMCYYAHTCQNTSMDGPQSPPTDPGDVMLLALQHPLPSQLTAPRQLSSLTDTFSSCRMICRNVIPGNIN